MSLGCAARSCGACCDPVHLSGHVRQLVEQYAAGDLDELNDETRADVEFTAEHWTEIRRDPDGGAAYRCDAFDPDTRSCTAHDQRPPVCSRFPWYSDPPEQRSTEHMPPQCSYLLDIAPADRPEGSRPLIPIEVLAR